MIRLELYAMVAAITIRPKLASWKCRILGHKLSSIHFTHFTEQDKVERRVCMRCLSLVVTSTKPIQKMPPKVATTLKRDSIEYGKCNGLQCTWPVVLPEMDEIERLKMWAEYLIDQACWRSAPYINTDGVWYPFVNSRSFSLEEFYAPDGSNFGSRAAWYYQTYYNA